MKILLVIHHELDRNAGASGVVYQLGEQYQKLGHHVQYFSFDNLPKELPQVVKGLVFPWFVASYIAWLSKSQDVDVVDASTGDIWVWAKIFRNANNSLPLLVSQSHGLEHIVHFEYLEEARAGHLQLSWKYPLYHGGFRLWEVTTSLRCSDLLFFLNQHELEFAIKHLGITADQNHVIPNGIPETFVNLPFKATPQAEDSPIRIAQVGSYILRKGICYGVPALNRLLQRFDQVEVSFVGTGCPEEVVYADFDPAVRDRIQVVQHYPHSTLPVLLEGHHINLFPSLSEGFSLALTEAMSCGLTPVATKIPGAMDLISDEHDGLLIPARDSHAIEQALERLITDRSYLEQLRRNAYATAQQYSWTHIAKKRVCFYEEALYKREMSIVS